MSETGRLNGVGNHFFIIRAEIPSGNCSWHLLLVLTPSPPLSAFIIPGNHPVMKLSSVWRHDDGNPPADLKWHVRYARRKTGQQFIARLSEALAAATKGVAVEHQRPGR